MALGLMLPKNIRVHCLPLLPCSWHLLRFLCRAWLRISRGAHKEICQGVRSVGTLGQLLPHTLEPVHACLRVSVLLPKQALIMDASSRHWYPGSGWTNLLPTNFVVKLVKGSQHGFMVGLLKLIWAEHHAHYLIDCTLQTANRKTFGFGFAILARIYISRVYGVYVTYMSTCLCHVYEAQSMSIWSLSLYLSQSISYQE